MPNSKSKAELERGVMSILLDQDPIATDIPQTLHINNLVPFANHPFKLYEGERLDDMVRSIKEHGIITPIVARPLDEDEGTYEILSGHNRVNAAKIAGLTKVPVHIKKELSDEEAALMPQPTQDKLLTKAARAAAATFKKINFAPIPNSIGNVIPIQLGNVTSLYKALRRISTPSML